MRRLDSLTMVGGAALLVGAWGLSSAARPAPVLVAGACVILLALTLLATVALWRALSRFAVEATGALFLSWLGVGPAVSLLAGLGQEPDAVSQVLPVSLVSLLWYGCGPLLLAASVALAPPRESPAVLNLLRGAHLLVWTAAALAAVASG